MKKIIFIILILYSNVLIADERQNELDKLFNDLKINNASLSFKAEQKIWKLWSTHPSDQKLTEINVTSPTGIRHINELSGLKIEEEFWNEVIKTIS